MLGKAMGHRRFVKPWLHGQVVNNAKKLIVLVTTYQQVKYVKKIREFC
jgi:hypothetical protein